MRGPGGQSEPVAGVMEVYGLPKILDEDLPSSPIWASVASWFMRPEARNPALRSPPTAFPLTPTICTSIRCTVPGCSCDCFTPGKVHVRYCETCSHAWVPHALDKLGLGSGVEPVQATLVFDIASLVLYGCQALPIRLKILLDRLFSVLHRDEVAQILRGFSWTPDDYARGYIMQEHGAVLDRWNICSGEEEPLVLQQFLRFGETRAIAQQLLMHVMGDARYLPRVEADVKKFMERLRPPPPFPPPDRPKSQGRPPLSPKQSAHLNSLSFVKPPPMSPPPVAPTSTSPVSVSPLNRLQNMQPFDFRKVTPAVSRASPERRQPSPPNYGLNLTVTSPARLGFAKSPDFNSSLCHEYPSASEEDDSDNSQSALNLSKDAPKHRPSVRKPSTPLKRQWGPSIPPNLGTQLINPTTGKKRVQCNVCLKTFCDKGALKIHFSAVHLREMHKCTVEGCNMMFSSRRSRNRHSANPNPKLHSPHLRRKISPHDGRTAQNHPIMLPPGLGPSLNPLTFGTFGSLLTPPADLRHQAAALDLKQSLDLSLVKHEDYRKLSESSEQQDDFMDEDDEEGIVVEGDDYEQEKKRAKMSESEGDMDEEVTSNEDSLVDSQASVREDPENLVTKSSRKRKNQNPTKCAVSQPVHNNGDINSDESSNEVTFQTRANDNDIDHAVKKEPEQENNNQGEKKSPMQVDYTVHNNNNITSNNKNKNNNKSDCEEESQCGEDASDKKDRDSNEDHNGSDDKSSEVMGSTNALRQLENLSQGHFGDAKGQDGSESGGFGHNYLSNNNPPSPARSHSSSGSDSQDELDAHYLNFPDGFLPDVPIDKDNPRMCTACGKVFQNHFGVKTHYQNVHLKLMHKCTVDGCNAAFPSKRSRDRHSANLNLHRKLLSTPLSDKAGLFLDSHPSLHGEFLARLYGEQGLLPPPGLDIPPPVFLPHLGGFLPRFAPNGHPESPLSSPDSSSLLLSEEDIPTADKEGRLPCTFCRLPLADLTSLKEHLELKHAAEVFRCSVPGCKLSFLSASRRAAHSEDPTHPKPSS